MKKIKGYFIAVLTILYALALLVYSRDVSQGIISSLKTCLNVIIPSLFPFMVVSGIIISSGLYAKLGKPFSILSRYILRIPSELFSVFLISSVGGYPIGAKLLTSLYDEDRISRESAEKMLGFCYMGGPAFFIGAAGTKIYGSAKIGIIIFTSIFLSNITASFFMGIRQPVPPRSYSKSELSFTPAKFISSVSSGGAGIAGICVSILFFSSIISALEASGILDIFAHIASQLSHIDPNICKTILRSILEISNISALPNDISLLPAVTALLSFGGLCVIIQVECIIGEKISINNFLFVRIFTMILSYLCCKILIIVVDTANYTQASTINGIGIRQSSPIPSLFLLIMTILLLSKNYIEIIKKI